MASLQWNTGRAQPGHVLPLVSGAARLFCFKGLLGRNEKLIRLFYLSAIRDYLEGAGGKGRLSASYPHVFIFSLTWKL